MLIALFPPLFLRSLMHRRHTNTCPVLEMRHDLEVAADSDGEQREFIASYGGEDV